MSDQDFVPDWLGEKIVSAFVQGFHHQAGVVDHGQNDDGDLTKFTDGFAHLPSTPAGQRQVQDNQIGAPLVSLFDAIDTGMNTLHFETGRSSMS
jgi:hypothetical protein